MTSYVSLNLRRLVETRANHICEYCLIHESDTYFGCQVEHIISEKHGGPTDAKNLAYACAFCNRAKGSDLGTLIGLSAELTRFFNPRIDRWADHFSLQDLLIQPRTKIGEATAKIFRFNDVLRQLERQMLYSVNRYPSKEAIQILEASSS